MLSFFSKKQRDETILIADLGSASVSLSVVTLGKEAGAKPRVRFFARVPLAVAKNATFQSLVASMDSALGDAAALLAKQPAGRASFDRVFCFLSSPWHASEIRTIAFKKQEPFPVTHAFWRSLLDADRQAFEAEAFAGHSEPRHAPVVIERHDLSIKLNGYEVRNPFKRKAARVESSYFLSISEQDILDRVARRIRSVAGSAPVSFASRIFAFYGAARGLVESSDYLLAAVEGEITDLALVRNGALLEASSFPSGMSGVLRRVASALGVSFEEAHSLFAMHRAGKTDDDTSLRIAKALEEAERAWMSELRKALADISHSFSIPDTVFLLADEPNSSWLAEAIGSEDFNQYMFTEKKFRITPLAPMIAEEMHLEGTDARQKIMAAEALFASRYASGYNTRNDA